MRIEGGFFDGNSSRRQVASVTVEGGLLQVRAGDADLLPAVAIADVEVSSRVGNTPRFLRLPGGASFETTDNDAVDRLVAGRSRASGWVHRLESRLRFVVLGLVVTIAFVWAGVQWGVPALARVAAFSLPADVNAQADRVVLDLLDRQFLAPSKLPAAEQTRLQAVFAPFVADAGDQPPIRVLFRDAGGTIGPNALALPAGTIVITDQLVALARHDEELAAVLSHEIGHAVHRHALRRSIQASAMGLLGMLVMGDVSSVSSAVTAVPLILTELGYSRAFEVEADRHAVEMLRRHGVAPRRLADMLQRLDPSQDTHGYLSTHPPTPERVQQIGAY